VTAKKRWGLREVLGGGSAFLSNFTNLLASEEIDSSQLLSIVDRSSNLTTPTSANIGRSSLYPRHPIRQTIYTILGGKPFKSLGFNGLSWGDAPFFSVLQVYISCTKNNKIEKIKKGYHSVLRVSHLSQIDNLSIEQ
jgi:hypothetical protein